MNFTANWFHVNFSCFNSLYLSKLISRKILVTENFFIATLCLHIKLSVNRNLSSNYFVYSTNRNTNLFANSVYVAGCDESPPLMKSDLRKKGHLTQCRKCIILLSLEKYFVKAICSLIWISGEFNFTEFLVRKFLRVKFCHFYTVKTVKKTTNVLGLWFV